MNERTNKQKVVTYLVGKNNQTLGADQTSLFGTSTAMNIADQQLAVVSRSGDNTTYPYNEMINAAAPVAEVVIVQGTPASADITEADDTFQAGHRSRVESNPLKQSQIRSVSTQLPSPGMFSAAFVDPTSIVDETTYGFHLRVMSRRNDRDFGFNNDVTYFSYTTPDYSALTLTSDLDHALTNLLFKVNARSKKVSGSANYVAFGISLAGGATNGVAIGTITPTTAIPLVKKDGVTYNYKSSLAFVNTANSWLSHASITAASEIVLIDKDTAGANGIDAYIVMALDSSLAVAYDDVEQVRNRVEIILTDGFITDNVINNVLTSATEATGYGRKLYIDYMERARMSIHTPQILPNGEHIVEPKYYMDKDGWYTTTTIDFYDTRQHLTGTQLHEKSVVIALPASVTATNVSGGVTGATTATTTRTNLNTVLATWLAASEATFNGVATAAAPFA